MRALVDLVSDENQQKWQMILVKYSKYPLPIRQGRELKRERPDSRLDIGTNESKDGATGRTRHQYASGMTPFSNDSGRWACLETALIPSGDACPAMYWKMRQPDLS